jgi:hypothetical protein
MNNNYLLTPEIGIPFKTPSATEPYTSEELRISGSKSIGILKNLCSNKRHSDNYADERRAREKLEEFAANL